MSEPNPSDLCGDLRFEVSAKPVRLTLCYCTFCQRATGSTHMVEPIFAKSALRMTEGEPTLFSLTSSGSGKRVDVHFCPRCVTKLYLGFERFPEVWGVYAGSFDNPSWFERDPAITACLFLDSAQTGAIIAAGVPVFHQHRSGPDGAALQPVVFSTPVCVAKTPDVPAGRPIRGQDPEC